jgi:hypothetical protein
MAQKFLRRDWKARLRGMKLAAPGDLLPEGKYAFLQNVRSYQDGVIEGRPGLTKVVGIDPAGTAPVHSVHRLNNPVDSTYSYIAGASTKLYSTFRVSAATNATPIVITSDRAHNLTTGDTVIILGVLGNTAANGTWVVTVVSSTTFSLNTSVGNGVYTSGGIVSALRDTGYSGNPLTFVPHQPAQSPEPWVYIADSLRLRKINSKGLDYQWGIAPFTTAPSTALVQASYKTISDFENTTESAVAWTNGGTAGAIATVARLAAVAVTAVVYDTGTTGWASVIPTVFSDSIQPGIFITTAVTTAETALIDSVYDPIFNTSIQSVAYDSGTTGACTVQLTVPTTGLVKDCVVYNSTRTQRVRVLSVTDGPTGIPSFRCDTGATTWAATDTIQGQRSFRTYFANTHNATTTFSTNCFRWSNTVGVGYVTHVLARDLSNTGSAGRPISDDDIIHISVRFDSLSKFTEGRIFFDVDGTTNDFTRNYFWAEFRVNDLTPALSGSQPVLPIQQRIVQREQIDTRAANIAAHQTRRTVATDADFPLGVLELGDFNDVYDGITNPPGQTGTGDNQWFEIRIRVGDLKRTGADSSRTLRDVAAIRVQVNSTDTLQVDVDAWWIGGTYGLDLPEDRDPYVYRARPRSLTTGAKGNPSPPIRSGIRPTRQSVSLSIAQHSDSQVDVIDWFRSGGDLLDWYLVGSSANSATPTFTDEYSDEIVKFNPILEFDNFQPFPIVDTPKSGTCNVKGSVIEWVSGDVFNTSWAEGSLIEVDGVAAALYTSPSSTTRLEIQDSLGTRSAVPFRLPSPTKLGQPLESVFGPYSLGELGIFIFGCKEGRLYWTKAGDPDAAPDTSSLRITSGSEVLINGCIYDGRPYLFSDRRMYQITPTETSTGTVSFQVSEVAHSEGLWSPWGITVSDQIYFIGKHGIYASSGGIPTSITDEDLFPLFPHDGVAGATTNGIFTPDYSLRTNQLSDVGSQLFFNYKDSNSNPRTLVFDRRLGGWISDTYGSGSAIVHEAAQASTSYETLVGVSSGNLFTLSGTSDNGASIACTVSTPSDDLGEPGANKLFGDFGVDIDPQGTTVSVTSYYNNYTAITTSTIAATSGRSLNPFNINSGSGILGRNFALGFTWSRTSISSPQIFGGYYAAVIEQENTVDRATDWSDAGYPGPKWVQGVRITANTFGLAKTVKVEYDGGTLGATLTVNHNGRIRAGYPNTASPTWEPFIATLVRLRPTDSNPWILTDEEVEWIYEPEPDLATFWKSQPTTHDQEDYHFVRELRLTLRSTAAVTLTISVDGVNYTYTLSSTSGNQRSIRVVPSAVKGKVFQYTLSSSAGFRIYKRDCTVLVKRPTAVNYEIKSPFGDISRVSGARI